MTQILATVARSILSGLCGLLVVPIRTGLLWLKRTVDGSLGTLSGTSSEIDNQSTT